ncbi:hypothetical protein DFR97_000557 [Clostridium beijerinckii]|nr:hypothetical protein [Clostridium beijerinckii]NRZ84782.1 hypothetical protein [Clostridium beijerinckii]
MDTRLKRKIKIYFSSIYLVDIIIVALITLFLLSALGDYIQINRSQHSLAVNRIKSDLRGLLFLAVMYVAFITKIIFILKKNQNSPRIQSDFVNNVIFVIKNGFHYKETRSKLIISIALALILLIAYLYFLATGGYENNIFVKFFSNVSV